MLQTLWIFFFDNFNKKGQPLSLFSRQPPESEINFEVNTTWIRLQEHWTILKSNAMLTRLIAGIIPLYGNRSLLKLNTSVSTKGP